LAISQSPNIITCADRFNKLNDTGEQITPGRLVRPLIGHLKQYLSSYVVGIYFAVLLTAVLSSVPVWADQSTSGIPSAAAKLHLTLDEAIQLALERNRGLLNQRLNRETQRFSLDVAEDRYRPQFTVSASGSHNRNDGTADVRFGSSLRVPTGGTIGLEFSESISGDDESETVPTLRFSQPLLKGAGANIDQAQLRRARITEKTNILAFRRSVSELVVSTIGAYRALSQAYRQVEITEASVQRANQQLDVTRSLIQAGRVARREITRSEATIANRELALLRSKNRLDSANFNLINTLDLDSSTRIQPQEDLAAERFTQNGTGNLNVQQSIEAALRNRSDYRSAELAAEAAEISSLVAENDKLPDLSFDIRVKRDRALDRTDHQASLNLKIPLNDRNPKLKILQAQNNLIIAKRNLEELRESIGVSIRQAINDVEVGFRVMELAGEARQLAEENLTIEQNKFSQGLSSTFEVSASELDLVSAQNSETDAIIGYLDALTKLDHTMGLILHNWGIEVETVTE